MRKAAGIILMIYGIFNVIPPIASVSMGGSLLFPAGLLPFVFAALLVAGGIFCLKRRYWGACLASALVALFVTGRTMIYYLRYLAAVRAEPFYDEVISVIWQPLIPLVGVVIATIFIIRSKKEWQEISDSVDGRVSYGG